MQLFHKTLLDALRTEQKKTSEVSVLEAVQRILAENETERQQIKTTLQTESSSLSNAFQLDLLETDHIFHLSQIKKVCIDYRLRFLDSSLFANPIPEEAITQINALEKAHQTKLDGFTIAAPSKTFTLKQYDDPLLFAPIGNGYYYLIHQWGNDLKWYRKLSVLPIKNIVNFVIFCVLLSALFTLLTPETQLSKSIGEFAPVIIFLFLFKSVVVTIGYYFFMMGKNFNNVIWNREFKEN